VAKQGTGRFDDIASAQDDLVLASVVSVALLIIAEGLILFRMGDYGLLLHALTVVLLIGLVYHYDGESALFFQSLLLVPVLRVFNLGFPPFTENPLVFIGVVYVSLLVSSIIVIRSQELTLSQLGLTRSQARLILPGILVGIILGAIQFMFSLEPLQYDSTFQNHVLAIITTGLLVGIVEEFIFRGLLQRWATNLFGRWTSIIGVSILFGFMHSVWLAPMDILFAGAVSVFLGWSYDETNNMWFITSVHAMINISAFMLLPVFLPG
jgi:membrane protease YdiL (CAAX protease family)